MRSGGGRRRRKSLTFHEKAASTPPLQRIPRPGQNRIQKRGFLQPPKRKKKSGGWIGVSLAVTMCPLDPLCYLPFPRYHMPLNDFWLFPPNSSELREEGFDYLTRAMTFVKQKNQSIREHIVKHIVELSVVFVFKHYSKQPARSLWPHPETYLSTWLTTNCGIRLDR